MHQISEKLVTRQFLADELAVSQVLDPANTVDQHHLFETFVGLGVLDQADEWREARAGGQQIEILAGAQIAQHQRSGRLATDHHLVTDRQVLQFRGERAVGDLDAEELQVVVVVGAGDAVRTRQRTPLLRQANHQELSVDEAQRGVARGAKTEQRFVPVMYRKDALRGIIAHGLDPAVRWMRIIVVAHAIFVKPIF
ncbi:MAG: hypothetical protein AW09_004670 [Candidatus Accumulibacter phosphatis]|uniref:Uncharacterized protein n=1 Tax=Candidatus Accumulibacter phosphatis TaxID=327160 RepID=A0A084Y697_9PROT|nr:MAG: hypothetical protein AW09_004670 [Candidatus Accumulibacter phosphatis]